MGLCVYTVINWLFCSLYNIEFERAKLIYAIENKLIPTLKLIMLLDFPENYNSLVRELIETLWVKC
jgi:hypothetical protein